MLRIYYGRESIDKESAMYSLIGNTMAKLGGPEMPANILLIVPDQYTLQAERNAISHLKVKGLIDLEVLSFSRLAENVLNETGGSGRIPINKHGRHMLLSKIIKDCNEELMAFRNMGQSQSFIEMANNLISEIKQFSKAPEDLITIIDGLPKDGLLRRKLSDMAIIFQNYEDHIRGKYIDTEDHLSFFISKIGKSALIKNSEIWISGFDTFTPKNLEIIKELCDNSYGVNIMLTWDNSAVDEELFKLTKNVIWKLEEKIGQNSAQVIGLKSPQCFRKPPIKHLERQLFAHPFEPFREDHDALNFCKGANFYNEAETAATYITHLVRDKGLRFRDITVICNDIDGLGPIIRRVFDEYGISIFIDKKHGVLHNPAIAFISALLDVVGSNWSYEDVFALVKAGFCPIDGESAEDLENYCIRYRIRGKRWKKDFIYGKKEYGDEEFETLNHSRKTLVHFISEFEDKWKNYLGAKERTALLSSYLKEKVGLEDRLEELCVALEEAGEFETAMEMQQIWEGVLGLFDQIGELLGEEEISGDDYASMLKAGFESMELGLIPTTIDQVVVGTMQRTRTGKIKALVVMGANDGILPATDPGDDLLSRDERAMLQKNSILICKDDDLRNMEERLAIYKQLSKPEEYLWIGYSSADLEGKEMRPSIIFDKLRKIFPNVTLEKDIRNRDGELELLAGPKSSLKFLTEALKRAERGEEDLSPLWKATYNWYKVNDEKGLLSLKKGMDFDNRVEKLQAPLVTRLYSKYGDKELSVSPSRLERFSRCPFSHLVHYGLAPKERRMFEVAGREVGDVYHQCLMIFAQGLTAEGLALNHMDSPWMTVTEDECGQKIAEIMDKVSREYREGMLRVGDEEAYRASRMEEVCKRAAWALVEHVRQGQITKMYFEEAFGRGKGGMLSPIEINTGDKAVYIEGKIDRIDVLPGNFIKIIDYKSGKEKFNLNEALGGWRLQLMLYLKATMDGFAKRDVNAKPAGVFYFEISDAMINAGEYRDDDLKEKLEGEIRKLFRLDGIVLDDATVIENIAGEFSGFSEILPVRKNKEGVVSGTSENKMLTEAQFQSLTGSMEEIITGLCRSLASGETAINPKKTKYETACKYCDYMSICNFELSFDGCAYHVIK